MAVPSLRWFPTLLAILLIFSVGAQAAKRPGAPRPLLDSNGAWLQGTMPIVTRDGLFVQRSSEGTAATWLARPDGGSNNKSRWLLAPQSVPPLETLGAVSPDRLLTAVVSKRSGLEAIYVQHFDTRRHTQSTPRRVVTLARNPVWLDAQTLIFESTRPGRLGLYKVSVPWNNDEAIPAPQMLFTVGGEAAVSPDGKMICLAAQDNQRRNTQLYLLSPDGSGARAVAQTAGARRPSFGSDGESIYFDAPAPDGGTASARTIWMLPLVSNPPAAQLLQLRPKENGEVDILGTAFSPVTGALNIKLEIGEGEEPTAWKPITTRPAPIHNNVLASWKPGTIADDSAWTLRLLVTDGDGDHSESTLTFNWPLEPASNAPVLPPLFATQPELYGLGREPAVPTNTPEPVLATPAVPPGNTEPVLGSVALPTSTLPLPAANIPEIRTAPRMAPQVAPAASVQIASAKAATPKMQTTADAANLSRGAKSTLSGTLLAQAAPRSLHRPAVRTTPMPRPPVAPAPQSIGTPTPKPLAEKQQNSGGIPAQMKVGTTVPVTVVLRNTGSRSWSSQGESPVRLILRWVDARNNIRHRWAVRWLRETVQPGQSTRLKIDLQAPSRAGNFILTYALVRLNSENYDGKNYRPPSSKNGNQAWPGEFGAVSFRIKVVP